MINTEDRLSRNLGMMAAFAIGLGAMIGPGIFGLLDLMFAQFSGPTIILSYLLAGLLALQTAFSLSEMTTAFSRGGIYYFVSRALGMQSGLFVGLLTWLALTAKAASALRGLAGYFTAILPIPIYFIAIFFVALLFLLNYKGSENSVLFQFLVLSLLLISFTLFLTKGFRGFNQQAIDFSQINQFSAILLPTGLIFLTYLALAQLALISDEVRNYRKVLPKVFIISVIFMTFLAVAILIVINLTLGNEQLMVKQGVLFKTAYLLGGNLGQIIALITGFLATLLTVNATLLSSSRLPFSIGRDKLLPEWIMKIHQKHGTPYRTIIITAVTVLTLFLSFSLENLIRISSSLNLLIFLAINLAVIIFRYKANNSYKPTFKTPFFPLPQLIAISGSLILITQFDSFSFLVLVIALILTFLWFRFYAVKQDIPAYNLFDILAEEDIIADPEDKRKKVLVPVANPEHEIDLLWLANNLADVVVGLNIIKVPSQTELWLAKEKQLKKDSSVCKRLKDQFEDCLLTKSNQDKIEDVGKISGNRNYIVVFAHKVAGAILEQAMIEEVDLIVMGWPKEKTSAKVINNLTNTVLAQARKHIAVLSGNLPERLNKITISYKGGPNSEHALYLAQRLALNTRAKIEILRLTTDEEEFKKRVELIEELKKEIEGKFKKMEKFSISYELKYSKTVLQGMLKASQETDLIIIGDSLRRFKKSFLGDLSQKMLKYSQNPVLIIKRYRPISKETFNSILLKGFNKVLKLFTGDND